jgi:probable rRNA maturation factor
MIRFFSEEIPFLLNEKPKIRRWLRDVILKEKKKPGSINIIFCTDDYLLGLNTLYLKHNTLTDILTFPGSDDPLSVEGDIYISIPRVTENAQKFSQPFDAELSRVMVHGILHLLGYKDKTKTERLEMTAKEDQYLSTLL